LQPERADTSVVFWDVTTESRYTKHIKNVKFIRAAGENVLIVQAVRGGHVPLDR
jgi:hypothetical protein